MRFESIEALLAELQSGDSVFIGGSSAEPRPVVKAISRSAPNLPPLEIVHSFVPGINPVPMAEPGNQLSEIAVFPRTHYGPLGGLIPATYYDYNQFLARREFDWTIVQLSSPDEKGRCCLGPTVEFLPVVLRRSRNIIGIINPQVPWIPGSQFLESEQLTHTCEIDASLVHYDAGESDTVSERISANLCGLIGDSNTLQLGLGKVPTLLLDALIERKNLQFHTGLLTEGFFKLVEAGAISPTARHAACACLGSDEFYQRLTDTKLMTITGVEFTHAPGTLAELDSLVAINSALEVDLGGQANLEYRSGRQVSSAGGAPDFARAARLSVNGKSIIALPATAAKGQVSRIVPALQGKQPVSLTRHDIDCVVTEFGIAQLTGKSTADQALALIDIAAPAFRKELAQALSD